MTSSAELMTLAELGNSKKSKPEHYDYIRKDIVSNTEKKFKIPQINKYTKTKYQDGYYQLFSRGSKMFN